jgi:hypothetical protein
MRHLMMHSRRRGREQNCGIQRSMLPAAAARRFSRRQHQTPRACQPCGLQLAQLGIDALR